VFRSDTSAIDQLELWRIYATAWCEHKPSITVYVREHEWLEVGAWVYENFDLMSGVSFLPYADDDHIYQQAPYQEITYQEWLKASGAMPKDVNWSDMSEWEDNTITQELACVSGGCDL
jgi:ribonucleoside-diphosphate reductase alpha chain